MAKSVVLMHEAFESLRPGPVKEAVDGPHREMHAQPASPEDNLGGWRRRVGGWDLPGARMWQVVETRGGRRLESCLTAMTYDNASIAKGDDDWQDVTIDSKVELLPPGEGWGGPAGVIFRFLDSQRYYAACIDEDGLAKIIKHVDNVWDVLAAGPLGDPEPRSALGKAIATLRELGVTVHESGAMPAVPLNKPIPIRVQVKGNRLRARVGGVELEATDGSYTHGCVGFVGCRPARFSPIRVTATAAEAARLEQQKAAREQRLAAKCQSYGRPVVWRKYDTPVFGAGRRIRLGDLDGDGRLDFVLIQLDNLADRGSGTLTAMNADGKVLWQLGEPRAFNGQESSGDGPVQIHDIDGDGRNEVVCAWKGELLVLDGATGKVKQSAPLPPMRPLPAVFKENMLDWGGGFQDEGPTLKPSAICFADLAGRGAKRDVLLADGYHTLVALSPELKELWRTVCSHGHYPQAYDFDGDGRDDVIAGYHRMSPEGKLFGRVCLQDHQDAIYVGPLDAKLAGPVRVLMAAGEDGLLALTPEYWIRQRVMGHVQRLTVGPFRRDVPGLCVATVLYHGNPGIVSLFDSTLKKLWTRDFPVVGSTLQPVNWDGSGTELMLYSPIRPGQGHTGGLIDGEGELVVPLPDDGGPGFAALAQDFDGDGLDELMLWDHDRIWIYHNDAAPPPGPRYRPVRPPLCNMSNFQSYWSWPRWE